MSIPTKVMAEHAVLYLVISLGIVAIASFFIKYSGGYWTVFSNTVLIVSYLYTIKISHLVVLTNPLCIALLCIVANVTETLTRLHSSPKLINVKNANKVLYYGYHILSDTCRFVVLALMLSDRGAVIPIRSAQFRELTQSTACFEIILKSILLWSTLNTYLFRFTVYSEHTRFYFQMGAVALTMFVPHLVLSIAVTVIGGVVQLLQCCVDLVFNLHEKPFGRTSEIPREKDAPPWGTSTTAAKNLKGT